MTVLRLLVSSIPLEQLYKLVVGTDGSAANYSGWLIFVCFWCPALFFVWKDEDFSSISFRRQRPQSLFGTQSQDSKKKPETLPLDVHRDAGENTD